MRRLIFFLVFGIVPLAADDMCIQPYAKIGFGVENYKWNMNHKEEVTDLFTTAEWRNIQVAGVELGVKAYPFEALRGDWMANYWFEIQGDWSFSVKSAAFKGKFREVELFGPALEIETQRNRYRAEDFVFGVGYDFCIAPCLSIAHVLGYSSKKQHFRNHSGAIEVPENLMDELTFLSLHDFRYEASWRDVWTGFQLDWQPSDCTKVTVLANYHLGRFNAHGHWHLSEGLSDGLNFENHDRVNQNGVYQGITAKVQLDYAIPVSCWVVTLDCCYRYFLKANGCDRTKTHEVVTADDGAVIVDGKRHLKNMYHIESRGIVVAAGVKYDF